MTYNVFVGTLSLTQSINTTCTEAKTETVVSDISHCYKCQEQFDYVHHPTV